ncbi:hypothetical protein ABW21_db0209006 [Orbilia brochopaga]|nr:hypothetical protein ABW21_db0209006 [Drechslerella brochopaga]
MQRNLLRMILAGIITMTLVMTSTARVVRQTDPTTASSTPTSSAIDDIPLSSIDWGSGGPPDSPKTPPNSPALTGAKSTSEKDSLLGDSSDAEWSDLGEDWDGYAFGVARTDPEASVPSGPPGTQQAKTSDFSGPDNFFRYYELPALKPIDSKAKDEGLAKHLQNIIISQEKDGGQDPNAKPAILNVYDYSWTGALTFEQAPEDAKGEKVTKPEKVTKRKISVRSKGRPRSAKTKAKVKRAAIPQKPDTETGGVIIKRGLFDKFKSAAKSVFGKIKDTIVSASSSVVNNFSKAKTAIEMVKSAAGHLKGNVDDGVLAGIDFAKDVAKGTIDSVKNRVIDKLKEAQDYAKDTVKNGIEATLGKVSDGLDTVKNKMGEFREKIDQAITDGANKVKDIAQIDKIKSAVKDIINHGCDEDSNQKLRRRVCIKDIGKDGFKKLKGKVQKIVDHVPDKIKQGVEALTNDNSAFKDITNTVTNTAKEIKDGAGKVKDGVKAAGGAIEQAYKDGINQISKVEGKVEDFKGKVDGIIDRINTSVDETLDKARGKIDGAIEKGVKKAKTKVDELASKYDKTTTDVAEINDAEGIVEDVIDDAADGDGTFLGEASDFTITKTSNDEPTATNPDDTLTSAENGYHPGDNNSGDDNSSFDNPADDNSGSDNSGDNNSMWDNSGDENSSNAGDNGSNSGWRDDDGTTNSDWSDNGGDEGVNYEDDSDHKVPPPYSDKDQPGILGKVELRKCASQTGNADDERAQKWIMWAYNDGYSYTR